jgi:hypothetical protein
MLWILNPLQSMTFLDVFLHGEKSLKQDGLKKTDAFHEFVVQL